jgi:hypothetical protein
LNNKLSKRTFLKKQLATKVRRIAKHAVVKKILKITSLIIVIDIIVAVLGGPFLSLNVGTFLGKSSGVILSDLLFLEGAVIFAVGAFLLLIIPFRTSPTEGANDDKQSSEKRTHPGIVLTIMGAILIGLSIAIGSLFV